MRVLHLRVARLQVAVLAQLFYPELGECLNSEQQRSMMGRCDLHSGGRVCDMYTPNGLCKGGRVGTCVVVVHEYVWIYWPRVLGESMVCHHGACAETATCAALHPHDQCEGDQVIPRDCDVR